MMEIGLAAVIKMPDWQHFRNFVAINKLRRKMKKTVLLALSVFWFASVFGQVNFFDIQNISNEYGPSREPSLARQGDNLYMAWNQWGDIMFRKSSNGGQNWGNKLTLYSAFDYGGNYPVVAATQGKVYVAYYRNTSGKSQVFMVKSNNDGQSFGNEVQVTDAINLAQVPQIAASGDTVVIAYEDRDANWKYQIFLIKSTDGGTSWSAPVNLSNTTNNARWCNLAMRGNELYVVWNDQTGSNYNDLDLFFTKSENFGASWTTPANITNNGAYNARLSTKVIDNSIYIAVSAKFDGLQSDIMLYRSNNLGLSWQTPLNLSNNSGNSSRPDIWLARNFADNHRIYVVWSDETYHANERAYLRYSADNGFSWSEMQEFSHATEDASWPRIAGKASSSADEMYMAWVRPHDGTFNFEVWGRRAENILAQQLTVSGIVTDTGGNPIANATVALGGFVVFSMENGAYSIEVPAGVYDFTVSAAGYQHYNIQSLEVFENMVIDVEMQALIPGNYPPHLLQASVFEVDNILLQWEQPIGFNSIELSYDDGEANGMYWPGSATGNEFMAVGFEHDEPFYLRQLKLFSDPSAMGEQMLVHVLADAGGFPDRNTSYGGPFLVDVESGWTTVAVDIPIPANVRFYIACQWNTGNDYRIGGDLNQPSGFSYSSSNNGAQWFVHDDMDFMIRAGIAFENRKAATDLKSDLLSYTVYLNGEQFQDGIEETHFSVMGVEPGQTHNISVTAVYDTGESPPANISLLLPEPLLFPPLNLRGETDDTQVLLEWDAPASEGNWIHWDNGVNADAVGGSNIQVFDAAARFTAADLQGWDGQYLTKIAAFIADADVQVFARVWQGGNQNYAGTLVREQQIAYPEADNWNIVELEDPVLIDASEELWIGYRIINNTGGYPAGTDSGPAVPFKGDMLLYGSNWVSMYNQFGWNINWNIQGFVVDAQGREAANSLQVLPQNSQPVNNGLPEITHAGRNAEPFRWTYGHFNVYRNDVLLGISPQGVFNFIDAEPLAENNYHVTTAWGNYESAPSNSVYITTVLLNEVTDADQFLLVAPNPANRRIQVSFELGSPQKINLQLLGIDGRIYTVILDKWVESGRHTINLNLDALLPSAANGVYTLQMVTTEWTRSVRVLIVR